MYEHLKAKPADYYIIGNTTLAGFVTGGDGGVNDAALLSIENVMKKADVVILDLHNQNGSRENYFSMLSMIADLEMPAVLAAAPALGGTLLSDVNIHAGTGPTFNVVGGAAAHPILNTPNNVTASGNYYNTPGSGNTGSFNLGGHTSKWDNLTVLVSGNSTTAGPGSDLVVYSAGGAEFNAVYTTNGNTNTDSLIFPAPIVFIGAKPGDGGNAGGTVNTKIRSVFENSIHWVLNPNPGVEIEGDSKINIAKYDSTVLTATQINTDSDVDEWKIFGDDEGKTSPPLGVDIDWTANAGAKSDGTVAELIFDTDLNAGLKGGGSVWVQAILLDGTESDLFEVEYFYDTNFVKVFVVSPPASNMLPNSVREYLTVPARADDYLIVGVHAFGDFASLPTSSGLAAAMAKADVIVVDVNLTGGGTNPELYNILSETSRLNKPLVMGINPTVMQNLTDVTGNAGGTVSMNVVIGQDGHPI